MNEVTHAMKVTEDGWECSCGEKGIGLFHNRGALFSQLEGHLYDFCIGIEAFEVSKHANELLKQEKENATTNDPTATV
jgi:hypothetical protein